MITLGSGLTDSQGHRKLSPVSPLLSAASVLPAIIGFAFAISVPSGFNFTQYFPALRPFVAAVLVIGLASLALSILVALFQILGWRAFSFWVDQDGDLRVRSGVLIRNERRVQLSRIQAVDVVQPLIARIFSMAVLVVEVAGQKDSRVTFRFLSLTDATEIRQTLLNLAAGTKTESAETDSPILFRLPSRDLALGLLLRTSTVLLFSATISILIFSYLTEGWAGITFALVTGGVPFLIVIIEFITYYGFTVYDCPDGLRLRYGLLKTENRTVPEGRVQAIDFIEPLLWRSHSWTRVTINIAGVGSSSQGSSGKNKETLLLPVATRSLAETIVFRVLPNIDLTGIDWKVAPNRAVKRSPIQWRNLAMGWGPNSFAARRGRITRHLTVIPHARTQSVHMTQGPWERALNLASLHVDTTPGPVSVVALHLDADEVREALYGQVGRVYQGGEI